MEKRNLLLRGNGVSLSEMSESDQPFFQEWLAEDPDLRELIDDTSIPSLEDQMKWFERSKQSDRKLLSLVAEPNHTLIGNGGFVQIDPKSKQAQLRITIGNQEYRGKGLGKEATTLLLQFGRENLHLDVATLRVLRMNERAVKLYQSLGFEETSSSDREILMQMKLS